MRNFSPLQFSFSLPREEKKDGSELRNWKGGEMKALIHRCSVRAAKKHQGSFIDVAFSTFAPFIRCRATLSMECERSWDCPTQTPVRVFRDVLPFHSLCAITHTSYRENVLSLIASAMEVRKSLMCFQDKKRIAIIRSKLLLLLQLENKKAGSWFWMYKTWNKLISNWFVGSVLISETEANSVVKWNSLRAYFVSRCSES